MKIYFTSTPRGIKTLDINYKKIYQLVEKFGHKHVHDFMFQDYSKLRVSADDKTFEKNYKNTLNNLKKADIAVFEITTSSLGVGFLLNKSLELGKPTIALYTYGKKPLLIEGAINDRLQVVEYDVNNLEEILKDCINIAKDGIDVRFNFFVSPKIVHYLDWISKKKKIPRAVYLRKLIEKEFLKEKYI